MRKIISIILCVLLFGAPVGAKEPIKVIHKQAGVWIFKINTKKLGDKIKPLAVEELTAPKVIFDEGQYRFVLNGGFFDMKTGGEISYVIIDGKEVQSPYNNDKLINDLEQAERLDAVLSRGEFRILEKNSNGKLKFEIARHDAPVKNGYTIKHSLQAGPVIAPKMDLVGESFVKYNDKGRVTFEAASATKRRERTVLALKGHHLYAIVFTDVNKKTMNELRFYCNKKRFKHALALDGGGSTAVYFDDIEIYSEGTKQNQGRKVKSLLVIEK